MMTTGSLEARLSRFAVKDVFSATSALAMMRLSLFDWAGCGLAGADEPVSQILRAKALNEGGSEVAQLFGGGRVPVGVAALVNGTQSHALDYDDTHFAHIGHPSVAVIPAALAVGESVKASLGQVVEAALIGVEASIRFGVWLGRAHYQVGYHQTATSGAIGACLAAARLLGLDEVQIGHALGLVATRAAGLKSQFGTMGKPYNAGIAAQSGVEAALLAQAGMLSNPLALSGSLGFGDTHHGSADMSALDGLGDEWEIESICHKFHACCHGTHAAIEAILSLQNCAPERIEITTHPRWMSVCNIAEPKSGLEIKFSYRMIAAMVLSGHSTSQITVFQDSLTHDDTLCALRDRVFVQPSETLTELQARVRILDRDGTEQIADFDLAASMTMQMRASKLREKTIDLLGASHAENLWDASQGTSLSAFLRALT